MSKSRLSTALDQGLLAFPETSVRVMRPEPDYDLSSVQKDRVTISHSFKPDLTQWAAAGFTLSDTPCDVTIVVLPKSKALGRAMIAEATATSSLVVVDGNKSEGVDSYFKDVRVKLGDLPNVAKAHGRLFWFNGKSDVFADWAVGEPTKGAHGYYTTAGVFSDGEIDKGSLCLVEALPEKLSGRVADFGAGWGYLSAKVLERDGVKAVDLIEAEKLSLDCARLNITDERASFRWEDATTFKAKDPYQVIVMNPPFHKGRAAEPALGQQFIASAARNLSTSGHLWMVANRHLPYEAALRERFKNVEEVRGTSAFKVFHASRPKQ